LEGESENAHFADRDPLLTGVQHDPRVARGPAAGLKSRSLSAPGFGSRRRRLFDVRCREMIILYEWARLPPTVRGGRWRQTDAAEGRTERC